MTRFLPACAAISLVAGCALPGAPEPSGGEYPVKRVSVIVPFAAGGPTDLAGRVLTECLGDELSERFVLENRDGGAGAIGTLEMLHSNPDGYTLGVGTVGSLVIAPQLSEHATYRASDAMPISKIYELDSAILVQGDSEFRTAKEFFEAARKKDKSVSVAVGGASTEYALELQRMAQQYDVELSIVPFNGGAPAQNALMGGNTDALFAAVSDPVLKLIDEGDLRALATGGEKRSQLLPDQPTLAELGFTDLTNTRTFFSLMAPKGIKPEVRDTLTEATHSCLEEDEVKTRLGKDFIPADPGNHTSLAREYDAKWDDAEEVLR